MQDELRKGGYTKLYNRFIDLYARFFEPTAALVYISLLRHAQGKEYSYPSERCIAEKLGISSRTVLRAVKKLKALNVVAVRKIGRFSDGQYARNVYYLKPENQWLIPSDNLSPGRYDNLSKNVVTNSHPNKKNINKRVNKLASIEEIIRNRGT